MPHYTLMLDQGAFTCKVGVGGQQSPLHVVQNSMVKTKHDDRIYMAEEISDLNHFSSLFYKRPFDQGYCVDWDLQCKIWDRLFALTKIKADDSLLVITEPLFSPHRIQTTMDEIVFESYDFQSFCRMPAAPMAVAGFYAEQHQNPSQETELLIPSCSVVVDCGYSFTHIVPMIDQNPIPEAIRRINVGGKHLTNYLKKIITQRQRDVTEETHLVNDIKEKLCYVSMDFNRDMEFARARNSSLRKEYVIPNNFRPPWRVNPSFAGSDDSIYLNNERICVPEILFNPSDVSMTQAGIPEAIVDAIKSCPEKSRGLMYDNILLVGGTSRFPNFKSRVEQELRALAPAEYRVRIFMGKDPALTTWTGGSLMTQTAQFFQLCVSKAEYDESGESVCRRKFFPYEK